MLVSHIFRSLKCCQVRYEAELWTFFKQLKISLLFYIQQEFGSYEELPPEAALQAYHDSTQAVVLIIGTEVIDFLRPTSDTTQLQHIPYCSTDDQWRRHDFWVLGQP